MMIHRMYRLVLLGFLLIANNQKCEPGFDYEPQPDFPFKFEQTQLKITLAPDENLIKGMVHYTLSAKTPGQTRLVLNAGELAVEAATVNGKEEEFSVNEDSLFIPLRDSLAVGETVEVAVTWQSQSKFGLHRNYKDTFWSSLNPKALRHWMPTFDHPYAESRIEAVFTIPANLELVFNGRLKSDEVVSAGSKAVSWESKTPVPLTGLSFALGGFVKNEAQSGTKRLYVYAEDGLLTDEELTALLDEAAAVRKAAEDRLNFEYPYESVNIVVLENSYWEEKQSGAGILYLYKDLGSFATQLKRGMYSQWFGLYHRMEDFAGFNNNMELVKAALLQAENTGEALLNNPDSLKSISKWNEYGEAFARNSGFALNVIQRSLPNLIKNNKGVILPDTYEMYWYQQTGLGINILKPGKETPVAADEPRQQDPVYSVEADYDEVNSRLSLHFNAISGDASILSGLNLEIHAPSGVRSREISFTGKQQTVSLDIPPVTDFVTLSSGVTDISHIELGRFPIVFLINQLYSESADDRRAAARQLGYYNDNPDLQLAIGDVLRTETDSGVIAALLESFAFITHGDAGTEQIFLRELQNPDENIKTAAIRALANYADNEQVAGALRSQLINAESDVIFEEALLSYGLLAPAEDLVTAARNLIQKDLRGYKSAKVLELAAEIDTTNGAVNAAESLLNEKLPYETRKELLNLLIRFNHSSEYWAEKLPVFMEDFDPRIRSLALQSLPYIDEEVLDEMGDRFWEREFDPRVWSTVDSISDNNED